MAHTAQHVVRRETTNHSVEVHYGLFAGEQWRTRANAKPVTRTKSKGKPEDNVFCI